MGLAASQARLLNLTARMHDIEYKAQNLEAQKLQMANESRQVYQEYENALNKQKVQFKQIGSDGAATYVDASISTLLANGYQIKVLSGDKYYKFITSKNDKSDLENGTFTNSPIRWAEKTTVVTYTVNEDKNAGEVLSSYILAEDAIKGDTSIVVLGNTEYIDVGGSKGDILEYNSKMYYVTEPMGYDEVEVVELTSSMQMLSQLNLYDIETLRNLVEAGFILFEKPMSDGTYTEVNIATDTSLQEVTDEVDLKKAEAKYEADMRKINQKDKKFDTDLAAMEAERNAIKTEMETLKSVARDNVDRTYKLFG